MRKAIAIILIIQVLVLSAIAAFAQQQFDIQGHSTTGSDTYTVSITNLNSYEVGSSPVRGVGFSIIFDTSSSGACTLNVNGLGAITINGDITAGVVYRLEYNVVTDEFDIISSTGSASSLFPTTGTGTATGNVTGDLDGNNLLITTTLAGNTSDISLNASGDFSIGSTDGSNSGRIGFNPNGAVSIYDSDGNSVLADVSSGIKIITNSIDRLVIQEDGGWYLGTTGAGSAGQVLTNNGATSPPSWEDPTSVSLGTEGQVPFMNSTDDFDYSSKFTWDNTNNRLIAGNGTISSGTNNINFGDATTLTGSWSLTSAEESTVRGNNNTSSGWDVTVGDNTNANSGNGTTTSGIDNINYGIGSYVGGIGGQLSYVSTSQRGGFVHAFSAGSVDGKKPSGVEYLIANDGAFNVSRNTANQTAGHGSLAQDGAILGGINHNIPSSSPRSVIIGGDSIKARASDPDNVYVPYLNVTQMDQDSSLSRILVQNAATKKVHYRSISTMGLESVSVTTTGGTITLDFNSGDNDDAVEKMFIGSNTWATSKTLAFSNSSGKLVFNFHFEVTNVAGEIVCSTCIAAASAVSGTWDSGTDTWTPTETGKYEMGGTWDGSAWKIKIIGPFE